MKPVLEAVAISPDSSITLENIELPHFISKWHYHAASNEIVLFIDCHGNGFIGDGIYPFKSGTVGLIGAGLSHVWLSGKEYYNPENNLVAKAIVIKFGDDFAGKDFMQMPEMNKVRHLLQLSRRGLVFHGQTREKLGQLVPAIWGAEGVSRIIILLNILKMMSETNEYSILSGAVVSSVVTDGSDKAISSVFEFTMQNFDREIRLEEVATIANMTPNAFCRFFRKRALKPYTQFLNEIRIGNACKILMDSNETISNAGYASGYNNLTHFHRQFKRVMGITPLAYKNKYRSENFNTNS